MSDRRSSKPSIVYCSYEQDGKSGRRFFDTAIPESFPVLKSHENLNVSVYSAWLDARHETPLDGDADFKFRRYEFLGFLTAKLGMELPNWWRNEILSVDLSGDYGERTLESSGYSDGFSETSGIRHSEEIELIQFYPDAISAVVDGNTCRVELFEETFFGNNPSIFALDRCSDGKWIFGTADYHESQFTVFCYDCNGIELWKSTVSLCRQMSIANAIPGSSTLAIQANDNIVSVFWVNGLEVMLDVFDVNTGNACLRFTTFFKLPNM
jgi:hypothetical protein